MPEPQETVDRLVEAFNRQDLEGALALYEPDAVMIVQPERVARGAAELREAVAGFIALRPALRSVAQHVIVAGDLALYAGRWELRGTDPEGHELELSGESADVLRRQADGRWLVAIDNPWGAAVLGPA